MIAMILWVRWDKNWNIPNYFL